jgi:hypothetical protein
MVTTLWLELFVHHGGKLTLGRNHPASHYESGVPRRAWDYVRIPTIGTLFEDFMTKSSGIGHL